MGPPPPIFRAMPAPSLWDRLRRARIVQVLLVYLGASWGVLQIADVLADALSLPDWVLPVAVLLLLVGLVIILATAWVQSLPGTTAKEEAGEIPTDWQVAPADALDSLKAGKLPHLTWGRAILGGVVALSLLFGGAGGYVLVTGTRVPGLGPQEAGADVAATGIAVVPFHVTGGSELDLWREGMVDVLTTNLDGMGGYRTIDARTVMARWRERVGSDETPDLRTALEVAGSTGARFGLVGNLVGNPGGVRVAADIYDLNTGKKVTQSYVEGPADSVLALVGRLSVNLTRELLAAAGQQVMQAPRTAGLTTESLEALRHYLDGEAAYRRSNFAGAAAAFERAVGVDSTFALAWARLSSSYGWLENISSEAGARAGDRAVALSHRLPARERMMVEAERGMLEGRLETVQTLREAVSKYPDDAEAWFLLGEYYRHNGTGAGVSTEEDELEVFRKAVALDPGFTPYYVHLLESLIGAADTAAAAEALARYQELAPEGVPDHLPLGFALYLSPAGSRDEVLAALDTASGEALARMGREVPWTHLPDRAWLEKVFRAAYAAHGQPVWLSHLLDLYLGDGRLQAAAELVADPSLPPAWAITAWSMTAQLELPAPAGLTPPTLGKGACADRVDPGAACMFDAAAVAAVTGDRASYQYWHGKNTELAAAFAAEPGQAGHSLQHQSLVKAIEGIWALKQERAAARAVPLLRESLRGLDGAMGYWARWHLVGALEEAQPRDALAYLDWMTAGSGRGYALVRMGRVKERLSDRGGAEQAYRAAAETFARADEGHPYAAEARAALTRLGG